MGGLGAAGLGVLSGLITSGISTADLIALTWRLASLVAAASLIAIVCALATAARFAPHLVPADDGAVSDVPAETLVDPAVDPAVDPVSIPDRPPTASRPRLDP